MKIIGHKHIKYQPMVHVKSIDDIRNCNGVVWFYHSDDLDFKIASFCSENGVEYGVFVQNKKDFVLSANLTPKYIIVDSMSRDYQDIAKEYLLDCSILYVIESEEQIEEKLHIGADGVIFRDLL